MFRYLLRPPTSMNKFPVPLRQFRRIALLSALFAASLLLAGCFNQAHWAKSYKAPTGAVGRPWGSPLSAFNRDELELLYANTVVLPDSKSLRIDYDAPLADTEHYLVGRVVTYGYLGSEKEYPDARIDETLLHFCKWLGESELRLCGSSVGFHSEEFEHIIDEALHHPDATAQDLYPQTNYQSILNTTMDRHGPPEGKRHGQVWIYVGDVAQRPIARGFERRVWCSPLPDGLPSYCAAEMVTGFIPLTGSGVVWTGSPVLIRLLYLDDQARLDEKKNSNVMYEVFYHEKHRSGSPSATQSLSDSVSSGVANGRSLSSDDTISTPRRPMGLESDVAVRAFTVGWDELLRCREQVLFQYWAGFVRGAARRTFLTRYVSAEEQQLFEAAAALHNPYISELGQGFLDGMKAQPEPPVVLRSCPASSPLGVPRCYTHGLLKRFIRYP